MGVRDSWSSRAPDRTPNRGVRNRKDESRDAGYWRITQADAMALYYMDHPDVKRRILDMGAAIGNSTLVYCDAFPDAEIHAIDIGAPLLRYGYARATALGRSVHFSQQNAERTDFERCTAHTGRSI